MSTPDTNTTQGGFSSSTGQTGPPSSPARRGRGSRGRGRGSRGGGRGRGRASATATEEPNDEDDQVSASDIPAEGPIVHFEVFEKETVGTHDRNGQTITIQAPNAEGLRTFLEAQLFSRGWVKGFAANQNAAWTLADCPPAAENNPHFNQYVWLYSRSARYAFIAQKIGSISPCLGSFL